MNMPSLGNQVLLKNHSEINHKSSSLYPNEKSSVQPNMSKKPFCRLRRGSFIIAVSVVSLCIIGKGLGIIPSKDLFSQKASMGATIAYSGLGETQETISFQPSQSALIPLEVHVMSKCPDARDCLRDLVVPAMQNVSQDVDFRISFIGT